MKAHNHSGCVAQFLSIVMAVVLEGCVSLADNPATNAKAVRNVEAVRLACQPITDTEIHAPGDSHWIGHDVKQLRQVLGKEEMSLGKPSENLVLVYGRAGKDCLDAYVIDHCDRVVNYYCRPVPVAPMNWGRQPPVPETQ